LKRRKRQIITSTQIGVVSLPVMACVLAAVLCAPQHEDAPDVTGLEEALAESEPQVDGIRDGVERAKEDIEKAVKNLAIAKNLLLENERLDQEINCLMKETERLGNCVSDAQEKAALLKTIEKLNRDIAENNEAIAELKQQKSNLENRIDLTGLEEFPRPYISIECNKDAVIIHVPGQAQQSTTLPLSETRTQKLRTQIAGVKGVVVFARASSFHTTYSKMIDKLDDVLKKSSDGEIDTALSFVPVSDSEDVSGHILLGGES